MFAANWLDEGSSQSKCLLTSLPEGYDYSFFYFISGLLCCVISERVEIFSQNVKRYNVSAGIAFPTREQQRKCERKVGRNFISSYKILSAKKCECFEFRHSYYRIPTLVCSSNN